MSKFAIGEKVLHVFRNNETELAVVVECPERLRSMDWAIGDDVVWISDVNEIVGWVRENELKRPETFRVFPDFCSTGIWEIDGPSVDTKTAGLNSLEKIALYYWHDYWELIIPQPDEYEEETYKKLIVNWKPHILRWFESGKEIVKLFNERAGYEKFIYEVSLNDFEIPS